VSAAACTLRRAVPGDEAALALVGAATFLDAFAGVIPGPDIVAHCAREHASARYAAWLVSPEAAVWLAEVRPGEAAVGYAVLCPADLPLADLGPGDAEVKRIYLLSRFHGAGLGRALMAAVEQGARERGVRRLLLGVYGGNRRAIGFYRAAGFTAVGERRFTVGARTYDDLVMGKAL
jgi:ribosomal protein S18 acetylase RimI-like enzyme